MNPFYNKLFLTLKLNSYANKLYNHHQRESFMFRLLFLMPVALCLIWYFFLRQNKIPIKQGKKGFIYILIFSTLVLGFFILMMQVTHSV